MVLVSAKKFYSILKKTIYMPPPPFQTRRTYNVKLILWKHPSIQYPVWWKYLCKKTKQSELEKMFTLYIYTYISVNLLYESLNGRGGFIQSMIFILFKCIFVYIADLAWKNICLTDSRNFTSKFPIKINGLITSCLQTKRYKFSSQYAESWVNRFQTCDTRNCHMTVNWWTFHAINILLSTGEGNGTVQILRPKATYSLWSFYKMLPGFIEMYVLYINYQNYRFSRRPKC